MGLRNLSVADMAEISGLWLTRHRSLFDSIPEIAGLLPHVQAAHEKVLEVAHPANSNRELSGLISRERELDRRQDHIYRAFYYLGKAWNEYALSQEKLDEDLLERVQRTLGSLLPKGLNAVEDSSPQQVPDAERARQALRKGSGIHKSLKELRLTDKVAAVDMLEGWFALADELGALERKKEQIVASSFDSKDRPLNSRLCRNEWIRVVSTVLAALEHSSVDADRIAVLRAPLDAAVQRSTIRYIEERRRKTVA